MILMNPKSGGNVGRPKTKPLSDALRHLLAQECTLLSKSIGSPKKMTWAQRLARKLIFKADQGDLVAFSMILNRVDGALERKTTDFENEPEPQPEMSIREVARRIGFILLEAKAQKEEEDAKLLEHENNLQPQT